jgi:hypothetical protein
MRWVGIRIDKAEKNEHAYHVCDIVASRLCLYEHKGEGDEGVESPLCDILVSMVDAEGSMFRLFGYRRCARRVGVKKV